MSQYEYQLSAESIKRNRFPWMSFAFIMIVFYLAPPLRPEWAMQSFNQGENIIYKLSDAQVAKDHLLRAVAMAALFGFTLLSFLRKEINRVHFGDLLGWVMLCYLLWAILSATWSEVPSETIRKSIVLMGLALGALAMACKYSIREIIALTLFVCGITLLISIGVELESGTFQVFKAGYRFCGVMHPIDQAFNCGLLSVAALAQARNENRRRIFNVIIFVFAIIFLILTRSRMALFTTILAGITYFILSSDRPLKHLCIVSLATLGIACFFYLFVANILDYDISKYSQKVAMLGRDQDEVDTLNGRIPLWQECLSFVAKRPVQGYGYNSFMTPTRREVIADRIGWDASHTHSGYVNALVGTGSVGAALFILLLFLAIKKAIHLSKSYREYAFLSAVLIWLCWSMLLETNIIVEPQFPTFLSMIILAKLGLVRSAAIP